MVIFKVSKLKCFIPKKRANDSVLEIELQTQNNFDVRQSISIEISVVKITLLLIQIRTWNWINSLEDAWWEETNSGNFSQELPMDRNVFAARGIFKALEIEMETIFTYFNNRNSRF